MTVAGGEDLLDVKVKIWKRRDLELEKTAELLHAPRTARERHPISTSSSSLIA
jgi:hypothetical protein